MQVNKDRRYIKYLESKGEGKIKWENWDRIVLETQALIEETLKNYKVTEQPKYCNGYKVYGYNIDGDLVKEWETKKQCCNELQMNGSTVYNYITNHYVISNLLLSKKILEKDLASRLYRNAIESGHVYSGLSRHARPIYTYNENGELVGVYESIYSWCLDNHYNTFSKQLRSGDKKVNNRLVSYSMYDQQKAKDKFSKIEKNYIR